MGTPGARIPRLVPNVNIAGLAIGHREAFVLSRIDGFASRDDVADLTGLSREDVDEVLARLLDLGAVEWCEVPPRPSRSNAATRTIVPPPAAPKPPSDAPLEPGVELSGERQRGIIDLFQRMADLSHYEMLGIARTAEKAEVRSAYFSLSKQFHPDTVYGKELGTFKAKLEGIFKRLTEAYDVLSRKKRRDEYDAYLSACSQMKAAERILDLGREAAAELQPEGRDSQPDLELGGSFPLDESRRGGEEVRRERQMMRAREIARATGRRAPTNRPPPDGGSNEVPRDRNSVIRDLARSLKAASDVSNRGRRRAQHYAEDARVAEQGGDLVSAANAIRLAVALRPDDASLIAEGQRLDRELAAQLADTYEKQAVYEEQTQKWEAAALSWAKVAEGRPHQPAAARRAARALLQSSGDLKRARSFAQKAVDLEPNNVENRVVLGRIYLAAGMSLNAKRELKDALALDPQNEIVKNLLRDLKLG